jgi:hypothetical protein
MNLLLLFSKLIYSENLDKDHRISHNIDCFLGSFCYIRTVFRLNCLTAQPLLYEGRAAVERGANSISKFGHHNINGATVENTCDVTGRRLVSSIYSWDIYDYRSTTKRWQRSWRRMTVSWNRPTGTADFWSTACRVLIKIILKCNFTKKETRIAGFVHI